MNPMNNQKQGGNMSRSSFTLVELMIAVGLFGLVMAGTFGVYIMCQKLWQATSLNMQTDQMARMALSKMIFGVGTNAGIREASSLTVYGYGLTGVYQSADTAYAHTHNTSVRYWEYSMYSPPTATDSQLNMNCTYTTWPYAPCWRLIFSNQFSGIQCIEYNSPFQTLSYGTNSQQRIIFATYVTNAVVTPDNQGVNISITVKRRIGNLVASNTASTYLRLRNNLQ